jgi:hypothetical protein
MALSDSDIFDLAKRMEIDLIFCDFKDNLKDHKLQYNKGYIINMEDEFDKKTGERNGGSHWTAFIVRKYPNGKKQPLYFDSYGQGPPEEVKDFIKISNIPHNSKDIQSICAEVCGWYCLAFLHWIEKFESQCGNIYECCEQFTDLFDDLEKSVDFKRNEFILKHFFRSKDPNIRVPIKV